MSAREYAQAMREHKARLVRVAERGGAGRLKSLYDSAQAEVSDRLRRLSGAGLRSSFTAHQARIIASQLREGQAYVAGLLSDQLGKASKEAQVEALRGLAADVAKLDRHYRGAETVLPIEEASRFWGVIDNHRDSLLRMHESSMDRYGAHLVRKMEDQLGLTLATGGSTDDAIDRIQDVADGQWYQGERIARTELAYAFNKTHAEGIKEAARVLPELMMRWTEHVDDETGEPLDDRVGLDSIAMHGQVAKPGELFTMPTDAPGVSASLLGQSWDHPPNRPHDRAVLSPWRKDWGVGGWLWENGRRVDVGE